jgi:hypothetical protein
MAHVCHLVGLGVCGSIGEVTRARSPAPCRHPQSEPQSAAPFRGFHVIPGHFQSCGTVQPLTTALVSSLTQGHVRACRAASAEHIKTQQCCDVAVLQCLFSSNLNSALHHHTTTATTLAVYEYEYHPSDSHPPLPPNHYGHPHRRYPYAPTASSSSSSTMPFYINSCKGDMNGVNQGRECVV